MKKIILLSFLLNLGLLGVLGYKFKSNQPTPVTQAPAPEPVASEKPTEKTSPVKKAATAAPTVAADKFSWHKVESEDYKKYIANLRAIHCPEATIRDIIIADVNKLYVAKLAPYRKPKEETAFQFWKTGNGWFTGNRESDEFYKMQSQFEKEKKALIKELLGIDFMDAVRERYAYYDCSDKCPLLENMPQDKKDKMQEIDQRYNDARQAFYRKTHGYQDEDDQAELAKMERQKHDELAKVLSPEELFEKELRTSDLANNLKWNELRSFQPTEEEFRAIFKAAQTALFGQTEGSATNNGSYWQQRQGIEQQIEKDMQGVMDPDRLKELKLSRDYEYSRLVDIVERNDLPKETAKEIYGMKAEVEKATRDIQGDSSLTQEQRNEKLMAIKAETEKTMQELLGERGFKSFKRNAWWLRDLVHSIPQPRKIIRSSN